MLRINDEAPNFTAKTMQGTVNFKSVRALTKLNSERRNAK